MEERFIGQPICVALGFNTLVKSSFIFVSFSKECAFKRCCNPMGKKRQIEHGTENESVHKGKALYG